jgi:hypothetical protein
MFTTSTTVDTNSESYRLYCNIDRVIRMNLTDFITYRTFNDFTASYWISNTMTIDAIMLGVKMYNELLEEMNAPCNITCTLDPAYDEYYISLKYTA